MKLDSKNCTGGYQNQQVYLDVIMKASLSKTSRQTCFCLCQPAT